MIIRREWTTTRKARTHESKTHLTTFWKGWFLIGIIPLYIKSVKKVSHWSDAKIKWGE